MGETETLLRSLLQYSIFLVLLVVAIAPLVMMLRRSTTCRMHLRSLGCSNCSYWQPRVHYDEHDLRTLQELEEPARPVGITGAYRMYQARRARMSLRLASWHEDVKKCGSHDALHYKLAKLEAQALESRGNDAIGSTASHAMLPLSSSSSSSPASSSSAGLPFDIRVVEINDCVQEDSSSSMDDAYTAMPETPVAHATAQSSRQRVLELRLQDDDEEKDDDMHRNSSDSDDHAFAVV